ncbi:hypothetical protein LEN26_018120 [Aphanomyces euteiches]|nr:hypothetical protein LEN26_018120 [Aphanomyces euteiches]KAH9114426.1 hypothetical protein AeMF1_011449 [Aphanomyces euteiches]
MSDYDSDNEEYMYESDSDDMETEMMMTTAEEHKEYEVIDLGLLESQQQRVIADVAEMLQITPAVALVLLRRNGWSQYIVQDRFYSSATPDDFLKECGAVNVDKLQLGITGTLLCSICGDQVSGTNVAVMGCGHGYCVDCWVGYLRAKLDDGPSALLATCIAVDCNESVPDELFRAVLDEQSLKGYAKWHLRSFVDQNAAIKWCPAPGCQRAIRGNGGECFAQCACGFRFCLRCGEEAHPAVHCELLRLWSDKCANESETANWVLVNTKQCPNTKCSVRIEKNQGCNHMTCKSCRHEFCWICMGDWKTHSGNAYNCNSFREVDVSIATAKTELERYLHFHTRFENHAKSEEICVEKSEEAKRRAEKLDKMTAVDFEYVMRAMDLLIECRRTLKYTYAFGYFMDSKQQKEKELFEFLQANLEANTEALTGLTEMPLDEMNIADVMNYTAVTAKFLEGFLEGVDTGFCR